MYDGHDPTPFNGGHEYQDMYLYGTGPALEDDRRGEYPAGEPDPQAQSPLLSVIPQQWDPTAELAQLLYESAGDAQVPPPPAEPPAPAAHVQERRSAAPGHRRPGIRRPALAPLRTLSCFIAALAAVIVAMVSVLSGIVSYDPLRHLATPGAPHQLARWWPLLVYGPWMVASLSVLRAALHRRRAVHSWSAVLLFSGIAVALCVAQVPKTPTGCAVAALPPLAALTCFQQLVRQITLTKPPRQTHPRHRGSPQHCTDGRPAPR